MYIFVYENNIRRVYIRHRSQDKQQLVQLQNKWLVQHMLVHMRHMLVQVLQLNKTMVIKQLVIEQLVILLIKQQVIRHIRLVIEQLIEQLVIKQLRVKAKKISNYIYSLNFSFNSFIFNSWDCLCNRDIFCLLFINCSWDILSLIFDWIVICHIFCFWDLNLNCLCFHFYYRSLVFSVFNSWFSFDCWLSWLNSNRLNSNWLSNNRLL